MPPHSPPVPVVVSGEVWGHSHSPTPPRPCPPGWENGGSDCWERRRAVTPAAAAMARPRWGPPHVPFSQHLNRDHEGDTGWVFLPEPWFPTDNCPTPSAVGVRPRPGQSGHGRPGQRDRPLRLQPGLLRRPGCRATGVSQGCCWPPAPRGRRPAWEGRTEEEESAVEVRGQR